MMNNIIRIGKVSSVNAGNRTARVAFADKSNLVSAPLKVIDNGSDWLPDVGRLVVCIYIPNGESDGVILGGL